MQLFKARTGLALPALMALILLAGSALAQTPQTIVLDGVNDFLPVNFPWRVLDTVLVSVVEDLAYHRAQIKEGVGDDLNLFSGSVGDNRAVRVFGKGPVAILPEGYP